MGSEKKAQRLDKDKYMWAAVIEDVYAASSDRICDTGLQKTGRPDLSAKDDILTAITEQRSTE